jgi:hypothetical protein
MIFDVYCADRHGCADACAFTSARHLPIHDLKARSVTFWVAHENALRGEAAVEEALAMRVGHRFAELADESQSLIMCEASKLLTKIAIESDAVRIVLEDESRAKLSLTIVEDTLDACMLYTLQNAELSLRGAR